MSGTDRNHHSKLATWAEGDHDIDPAQALRGRAAAEASDRLLRSAGRPRLEPTSPAGASPRR